MILLVTILIGVLLGYLLFKSTVKNKKNRYINKVALVNEYMGATTYNWYLLSV